jgi:protein TonB
MTAFSASSASPLEPGAITHSRGALALAVVGHVIGALIMVKLLDTHRPLVTPPLIVEILQPEPEVEEPPPPPKKKPPEPKVEEPPPPEILPEPLPQAEPPPPPPAIQPIRQQRHEPIPEQIQAAPKPETVLPPIVRRPVEPVQAPPPPVAAPRDPVRTTPAPPILTAQAPSPVQTVAEPPRLDRPISAPEGPRVAPREPPRRHVPEAPPAMEVAATPLADTESDAHPAPAPLPIGPVPEGPEIDLDAASLTALYLRNPKPTYPAASRRLGEQGTVYVRAFINISGEAKSVELKKSSGYPRLDRAALDAIKAWKFVPAKRDDKPIEAAVIVPMKFSLATK